MRRFLSSLTFAVLMLVSARAEAVPVLQLDIIGGTYDWETQTIISNSNSFTLVALLTPKDSAALYDTYYISAALTPQTPEGTNPTNSSFSFGGTTYQATEDMTYGVPPLEEGMVGTEDPGDLQRHGIYPTYFREFAFSFYPNLTTGTYDAQYDRGGLRPGTGTYYQTWQVETALGGSYQLHFDLYDTVAKTACSGPRKTQVCGVDVDLENGAGAFAPFSHDAESSPPVPEPASMLLVGAGVAAGAFRRMRKQRA